MSDFEEENHQKFKEEHPYAALLGFSIVIALVLIGILILILFIPYNDTSSHSFSGFGGLFLINYWMISAPFVEIIAVYIKALFLFEKRWFKAFLATILCPVTWITVYFMIQWCF